MLASPAATDFVLVRRHYAHMSNRVIPEDVLRGVAEALQQHAPHFVPMVLDLIRSGLAEGSSGQIGESIYGKLTGNIPWEQGEPILRVLESIERDHGYQTKFAGRQINFLVMSWRRFAKPQQLPPQQ